MKFEFDYQCDKEWDEMKGGDRQRHCDSCDKSVHHLSGMTKDEALKFLDKNNWDVCVDFFSDADGDAVFREKRRRLSLQNEGVSQLVASALAVLPLALAAAFINVDHEPAQPAPIVAFEEPLPPVAIDGPAAVLVNPADHDNVFWEPAVFEPVVQEVAPPPVARPAVHLKQPIVEQIPEPSVEPVVPFERPRLRGKIKRPSDY